jgi:hypothetical protein
VAKGFEINQRGIDAFTKALQKEFDKRPIKVPIETGDADTNLPATTVNNYHGPVVTVHGDHAQLAWESDTVNQTQNRVEQIAAGYEDLAKVVTEVLVNLDDMSLAPSDIDEVRTHAEAVLGEVVKAEPNQGVVKRSVTMLKGLFAPVAAGLSAAATEESSELARQAIEALGSSLPF